MDKKIFEELLNKGAITQTGFVNADGIINIVEDKSVEEFEIAHTITIPETTSQISTPNIKKKSKSKSKTQPEPINTPEEIVETQEEIEVESIK